jgi:hypothetical protein
LYSLALTLARSTYALFETYPYSTMYRAVLQLFSESLESGGLSVGRGTRSPNPAAQKGIDVVSNQYLPIRIRIEFTGIWCVGFIRYSTHPCCMRRVLNCNTHGLVSRLVIGGPRLTNREGGPWVMDTSAAQSPEQGNLRLGYEVHMRSPPTAHTRYVRILVVRTEYSVGSVIQLVNSFE